YGWVGTHDGPCAGSQPGPGDRGCGIFEVDPANGHVVPRPIGGIGNSGRSHSVTGLAWSPDGMELAYLLDDRVWIFHVSTGRSDDIMRCPTFECDLAWSPDGTAIAVSHGDVLDLVGPKGDSRTTLTPLGPGATVRSPAWLPDGGIVVVGRDGRIFEIDQTGAHLRHLGDVLKGTWSPS